MFKKNRWKPLYDMVKNNDQPIKRDFVRDADVDDGYVSRGSSTTTLSMQFADGKYIICEFFYSTSFHRKFVRTHIYERYKVYCRGNGANHDITKYIKAKKLYKILSKKFNDVESDGSKLRDVINERDAFAFVFGEQK